MQSILNQLIYFGFLQGLFLLGIYVSSSKKREQIGGYLALLIIVLMIGLSGRILNATAIFGTSRKFIAVSEFSNLLFGSTTYLFTRASLFGRKFHPRDLLHYLPAAIYSAFILVLFIIPSNEEIKARYAQGGLTEHIIAFIGFALVFNIGYWMASYSLFRDFKHKLGGELSYVVKTRFFHIFLIAIGICLMTWVVFYFISIFGSEYIEVGARNYIWTSIGLILLFISFYTMKEPELFRVTESINQKKYIKSRLSEKELDALKEKLDRLMTEKKPYLNRRLMKADLAELLGVNNPEIARLLNESIGMNFFEYVNYYRIKEFVKLAESGKAKHFTFYGLAQEAGFNSKTTFNKSFKKLMGSSPREYFRRELD
ncbi:MAG: AraC family transcriptional regulator [Cyclobacteriaceae bacterium]|nr:AraC family transcriptional regulator [Cyclobacteriaceae bacterium HetDA_MAG_MS6]